MQGRRSETDVATEWNGRRRQKEKWMGSAYMWIFKREERQRTSKYRQSSLVFVGTSMLWPLCAHPMIKFRQSLTAVQGEGGTGFCSGLRENWKFKNWEDRNRKREEVSGDRTINHLPSQITKRRCGKGNTLESSVIRRNQSWMKYIKKGGKRWSVVKKPPGRDIQGVFHVLYL